MVLFSAAAVRSMSGVVASSGRRRDAPVTPAVSLTRGPSAGGARGCVLSSARRVDR